MMRQNASDEVASWGNLKEKPHIAMGSTSSPSSVSDMSPVEVSRPRRIRKGVLNYYLLRLRTNCSIDCPNELNYLCEYEVTSVCNKKQKAVFRSVGDVMRSKGARLLTVMGFDYTRTCLQHVTALHVAFQQGLRKRSRTYEVIRPTS